MIVQSVNQLKSFTVSTIYHNVDWTGEADFVIDETNPANAELIGKIYQHAPYFDYVVDEENQLIDITPRPDLEPEPPESEIELLQEQVASLTEQLSGYETAILKGASL